MKDQIKKKFVRAVGVLGVGLVVSGCNWSTSSYNDNVSIRVNDTIGDCRIGTRVSTNRNPGLTLRC